MKKIQSKLASGGRWWIRTTEVEDNRFTVCPIWPLWKSPIFSSYRNANVLTNINPSHNPPDGAGGRT